jgi:hypothetical protein
VGQKVLSRQGKKECAGMHVICLVWAGVSVAFTVLAINKIMLMMNPIDDEGGLNTSAKSEESSPLIATSCIQPTKICALHHLYNFSPRVKVTWKASYKSDRVCGP